ncbi:phage terminase large subunit [Dyadobacter flavalbus]|uniref:Phage terminase large subunit n=2 Tax=Dyadobacter flavalbus TaxID=2579942 RepID=A0A5M8R3D4_9BACT|nr:phage terminase large subunit [Dyadobacter flavalbus]
MTPAEIQEYKRIALSRLATQKSLMNYTCYFFRELYSRKFVINKHHERICDLLNRILAGEVTKAIINIAPRYGKTELAVKNFISHGLALNPASKYIHLSYSDDLALDNSEGVKSIVEHEAYQELYPEVMIKKDSRSKKKWYTTKGGGVYATSAAGQVTGFGAGQVDSEEQDDPDFERTMDDFLVDAGIHTKFGGALIIDDPIKPEDADSETRRERINQRYDSTIKNRVNSRKTPIIIIMQRLHENDLCGYLLQNEPGQWEVLSLPCIQTDDKGNEIALWPFKHSLQELKALQDQNSMVFERQYMQNPQPAGGYLYGRPWKTYQGIDYIPATKFRMRKTYTDTADLGTDFLCSIAYIETETAMYVTDVIYTQAGMETTEPMVAKQIHEQGTELARVESNNGGRGFARNVEQQTRLRGNKDTRIEWFHQSANKYSRIFTAGASVQNLIVFPEDWKARWPKFAKHVCSYMAAGGNANDDAEDALTGMTEYFGKDSNKAQNLTAYFR